MPGRRSVMPNEIEKLTQENIVLEARYQWLTNVNNKMVVMIKNAADVFEEYHRQLDAIQKAIKETQMIYSRLHTDLQEALNEQGHQQRNSTGFRNTE
jgi:archaellum component FlaC